MTHAEGVRARQTHEHASGMIFQVSYRRDYIERTHCHWGKEPYFQLCFSFSLPFVAWISFVFRTWFGVSWMIKKTTFFSALSRFNFILNGVDCESFFSAFNWPSRLLAIVRVKSDVDHEIRRKFQWVAMNIVHCQIFHRISS